MIFFVFFAFLIGFLIGIAACSRHSDINIEKENAKLRKENEILWDRLKYEGKIDFTA